MVSSKYQFAMVAFALSVGGFPCPALAGGIQTLDTVTVTDSVDDLVGTADTASVGTVTKQQLQDRPVYRTGELLETVPGLIVTQHSGEGKANQYFLRGFNLDHGTDVAIFADSIPVNMRSHAHGQGYSDLNFIIPELLSGLQYKKGPYFAEEGDFGAAGAVHLEFADTLPKGIALLSAGQDGYRRGVLAKSYKVGDGNLLYGLELFHNDGPWTHPDNFHRVNGELRYSQGNDANGFNITALAYAGSGDATNQIPKRAVGSPSLPTIYDTLSPTDHSDSHRYSLSGDWRRSTDNSITRASVYIEDYQLRLTSDFTYFLDFDPAGDGSGKGDQFQQQDKRSVTGANLSQTSIGKWLNRDMENTVGVQLRNDNIFSGLFRTHDAQIFETTRQDHVAESSAGIYFENRIQWLEKFRTVAGLRTDFYDVSVDSNNAANSGSDRANITNPKLSLIFGPWDKTEYYVSAGGGFHSNDARGTTITEDPSTCRPGDHVGDNYVDPLRSNPSVTCLGASKVPLLVRTRGVELGVRTVIVPHLQSSLSVYGLDFDSELVFQGDAGNTAAGRPSRRVGIEFANYYTPTSWLTVDFDYAFARARFTAPDSDPTVVGDRIPGAVEGVASLGFDVHQLGPYFGGLRVRYFGPRPLIEDDSVRSKSTTLLEGRFGYRLSKDLAFSLDGFNLLDSKSSQIDYFYTSRLPGEPAGGVDNIQFHPVESRTLRLTMVWNY
jgi:hypothetical protein